MHAQKETRMIEVPVLIVGGGPVGLSAALLLAKHGIRSMLVERHSGTSRLPKARLVNTRTMEVLRQCGIESDVRQAGLSPSKAHYLIRARSVAGEELERREATFTPGALAHFSPTTACSCAQHELEPVLLGAIRENGLTYVCFRHELRSFEQDGTGVSATVSDAQGGMQAVRAAYLVGADGAQSTVRQAMRICMRGTRGLSHYIALHFRADLSRWLVDRSPYMIFIEGRYGPGPLLTVNGADEWQYMWQRDPGSVDRPPSSNDGRSLDVLRTVIGVPDLQIEILNEVPWTANALVADRYSVGRVFLAGDAAHEMTPSGGFGMNTGIQDVHNLAWKLAAVLQGHATPRLLETYEAERLPVGSRMTQQSQRNLSVVERGQARTTMTRASNDRASAPQLLSEWGLILGAAYASEAVIADGTMSPEVPDPVTDYAPVARPGHRAPHVWIGCRGTRLSTLDLFGQGFVLLAGEDGQIWELVGRHVRTLLGVALCVYVISADGDVRDRHGKFSEVYGIGRAGAVLVRPDGHVAWRTENAGVDPEAALRTALAQILGRTR
jgi:2-polyprenyl-6-methoxyphenol hydroxylase-like FAD-dependent oxidoreductase